MVPVRLILVIAIILFVVAMWYVFFHKTKKTPSQKQDLFDEIENIKGKLYDAEKEALSGEEESRKRAEDYKNRLDKLNKLKNKLN